MTGLKCDRCGQDIKRNESWERDILQAPFDPYRSEYSTNLVGGFARHIGECPVDNRTACKHCGSTEHSTGDAVCNRFDKQQRKPSLRLLVIDLGDSCVVKVEKGKCPMFSFTQHCKTLLVHQPFAQIRAKIDSGLPRLLLKDDGRYELQFKTYQGDSHRSFKPEAYDALSQLAGKPLPIYTDGWVQLGEVEGAKMWRYKKI